ncbi:MAG: MaoC family dehydratase [Burkholderiaceae bacterium]
MTIAPKDRYFEDYRVGEVMQYGQYRITAEEIIEFASRYDPQPFHLDEQAGRDSHFGGLVASGWMTGSVMMRMMTDHYLSRVASMGSPGLDEIRWLAPVRPGDVLCVRSTVLDARASRSKPDRGVIWSEHQVLNQNGEVVMTVKGMGMYRRRGAAAG